MQKRKYKGFLGKVNPEQLLLSRIKRLEKTSYGQITMLYFIYFPLSYHISLIAFDKYRSKTVIPDKELVKHAQGNKKVMLL